MGGGGGVAKATRYVKQGDHPGIADNIWFIPLFSLVYQRAQSYYRDMKAHINLRQEPLSKILYKKTNFKKVGFSTMALSRAPKDTPSPCYASDLPFLAVR